MPGSKQHPISVGARGNVPLLASIAFLVGLSVVVASIFLWRWAAGPASPPTEAARAALVQATPTGVYAPLADPGFAPAAGVAESPTPLASAALSGPAGPTPTLSAPAGPARQHVVVAGESLWAIAYLYNVSVADIAAANAIEDVNLILPGQVLTIPGQEQAVMLASLLPPTAAVDAGEPPTPLVPGVSEPAGEWPPSIISGDLDAGYPLRGTTPSGSLQLHYQPGTFPARNIESLAEQLDSIWLDLQAQLATQFARPVDVFLAGTLFAINPALQGYTQSGLLRTFVLVNGALDSGETSYILAHELTHIIATQRFGTPYSPMIHEGLALYLPQEYLTEGSGYLAMQTICAAARMTPAFKPAAELSALGYGPEEFAGHIETFIHYNLSGCFVGYLIETYGLDSLAAVYSTGDYRGVYGRSLAELDADWQASLAGAAVPLDPLAFVQTVEEVAQAYQAYLAASAGGVHANWEAYLHLNQARLAANQGDLEKARQELTQYRSLSA